MNPSYFSIIPASVRYDKVLKPNAKLLYGEITSLCNKEGYCWADNGYFADLYDVSPFTISRWISQLEKCGYVKIKHNKSQGNTRKVFIDHNVITHQKKVEKNSQLPIDRKSKTICQKEQNLLTKRARPIDEMGKSYKDNNKTNTRSNNSEETRSIDFFKKNFPSEWEYFLMQNKSQIKNFERFCADFNDTFDLENREYNYRNIKIRLDKYARAWIHNNQREGAFNKQSHEPSPYGNLTLD